MSDPCATLVVDKKEESMNKYDARYALVGIGGSDAEMLRQELFAATEWFTPMTIDQQKRFDRITCQTCVRYAGQMHPNHDASPRCESGGRNHCTCDTCF